MKGASLSLQARTAVTIHTAAICCDRLHLAVICEEEA
jgi:hypothetical protein